MPQKNRVYFACIIVLISLLFGCTPSNKSSDFQNLVFPKDCKTACWMGIEPNISTTDQTTKILESAYGAENVINDSGTISWNINNDNWKNRGNVFISNNTVDFVMFWFPKNYMQVKDIIAEIGNPDSVGLVISGPVIKCAAASLLYPDKGLRAYLSLFDKSVGVAETQIINGFEINTPWTSGSYPGTDTAVVPWDGYHEYCPEKWSWEK